MKKYLIRLTSPALTTSPAAMRRSISSRTSGGVDGAANSRSAAILKSDQMVGFRAPRFNALTHRLPDQQVLRLTCDNLPA
jgi:hypothetical protein